MAQASPTNILLAQASYYLNKLRREYSVTQFKSTDEIAAIINKMLTHFEENAGKSIIQFEPVLPSEPPNSAKMNRFYSGLQNDANIMQTQIDLLRAGAVDLHNNIKMEIKKAREANLELQNKLKTLQLYSNVDDPSLVYFGDSFITEDLIDWNAVSSGDNRLRLIGRRAIGLDVQELVNVLEEGADLTILDNSNGFLGNWHEIMDPQENFTTDVVTGEKTYFFKSETYSASDLQEIIDGDPTTWIEFEKYLVPESTRAGALNYNFNYKYVNREPYDYLKKYLLEGDTINWADGLGNLDALSLNLEIDLNVPHKVNVIHFTPFGLPDNVNHPIRIKRVSTSLDKTFWYTMNPQNVWIANGIDKKILDLNAENILIGDASWTTDGIPIRYIRFEIDQPTSVQTNIGHLYYLNDPAFGDTTSVITRQLGPVPTIDDPNRYLEYGRFGSLDLIQKMEYFTGQRWAIGIRDIALDSNAYKQSGSFVSRQFDIAGIVDRVALEADVEMPSDYDQTVNWVKFYVSPNNGLEWYPISRIQDDFLDLPEVLAFNDPTPVDLHESGVAYHEVTGTVNSLRLKVEISRPADKEFSTPVLKGYKLKIKKRL